MTHTVLVVVGTDHHRFDRLVDWVDAWALRQGPDVRVVFQHGSSRAPQHAEAHTLVPHQQLEELMGRATVLVTHGGPATICEVWQHGLRPVVVPRDPARGEHVDGHQQRFSRRLGADGAVVLTEDQDSFEKALDTALEDPASVRFAGSEGRGSVVQASVDRFGQVVDELLAERAAAPARRRERGLLGRWRRA